MNDVEVIERLTKVETKVEQHDKDILESKENDKNMNRLITSIEVMATQMSGFCGRMDGMEKSLLTVAKGQVDLSEKVDNKISDFKEELLEVKNAPAQQLSKNVNKIKVGAIGVIVGILVTGLVGVIITYLAK